MSNPASLQYASDDCQVEHLFSQLQQQWPIREQVSRALQEANAAFAAQCTCPDGYVFMQTCNDLIKFLDLKIPLEPGEQKLVVQILQVACAMHENAISNTSLTPTQRSFHYLATTSLVPLCKTALQGSVTEIDLWCEVFNLTDRAKQAHARATEELDLSKFPGFDNPQDSHLTSGGSGNGASHKSEIPSRVLETSKPSRLRAGPVRDTAAEARLTPQSGRATEKARAMLEDQSYKTAPLGRRHTMPTLSSTVPGIPNPSQTTAGRRSSKARARGHGLHALQEMKE